MKYIKFVAVWLSYLLSRFVLLIFRVFLNLGIFKELSRSMIASSDLGYSSAQYNKHNYGNALRALRKYEKIENDYCHGLLKYNLALLYFHGHGIGKDSIKAEALFIQSAKLGNDTAEKYLTEKSHYETGY